MSIKMYMKSLRCNAETDEVGSDEPFVLVTSVDRSSTPPAFDVTLYGAYGDVDQGDVRYTGGPDQIFWGFNGQPRNLNRPEDAIIAVGVMENDDGDPNTLRGLVQAQIGSAILGTLTESRDVQVARVLRDMDSARGTPTGLPNTDDKVGPVQELTFTADELQRAEGGRPVQKSLFTRGDGGMYTMEFEAVNDFGVFGAIRDKWAALGFAGGPLGKPVSDETPTFDGTGRARSFEGGTITWHPDIGAFAVWGAIGARWAAIGREQFGYPITDETPTADQIGRFNHFRALQHPDRPEASIFWSPATGAWEVYGAIRAKWAEHGWERGLGYPVGFEADAEGGRVQRFQRGSILWTPHGGAVVRP